jgi:hypothetical protein
MSLPFFERRDQSVRKAYAGHYSGWGSHWKGTSQETRRAHREKVLNTWLDETGYRREQLAPWVQTHIREGWRVGVPHILETNRFLIVRQFLVNLLRKP